MRKEIKIGAFAVIVLAVALFMIEFLKGKDIFSRNNTYYIIYPSVEGLSISTGITVGGYAAGVISDIAYNRQTMDYTVSASVSREFDIPEDSFIEIYSSDILGTKKLRVKMGSSPVMATSGDTLRGCMETDMLSSVTGGLDSLMRSIGTTVESVNLILNEENRAEFRLLLKRLNSTAGNLKKISAMLQSKSPDIETLLSNLSSISATLDSAATAISGTAANAEAITASLNEADLKGMTDSIRSLAGRLQSPDGSIGKLMRSDSLYNTLTALSSDLDSLVNNIRKDPKKYIKISIF